MVSATGVDSSTDPEPPGSPRAAVSGPRRLRAKVAQFWLGILISLACVVAVLRVVDLEQVRRSLAGNDWRLAVAVITVSQLVFVVLRARRWQLMLAAAVQREGGAVASVPYGPLFHAQNIGYLITALLPFRLGDLARSYLAGKFPGLTLLAALSSVFMERILDVLMIVLFLGLAIPFVPSLPTSMTVAGVAFAGAAVIGVMSMVLAAANRRWLLERLLIWPKRLGTAPRARWLAWLENLLDGLNILTDRRLLAPVALLTVLLWSAIVAAYYWGLTACWPSVTLPAALITVCAAAFGISAPSSPGSVGVFHAAVVLGLSVFAISPEDALSFAVVYHAVMYLTNLILGLVGLWRSGYSLGGVMAAVRESSGA